MRSGVGDVLAQRIGHGRAGKSGRCAFRQRGPDARHPGCSPPEPEQRAIAAFLDRETARIDALVTKVRDAIDRLKELRTALISAAVTGKIDVRGAPLLDGPQVTQ